MYKLLLTKKEMETLAWATARGYFPQVTYDAMFSNMDDSEELITWEIPEHAAWEISKQREEDNYSLFTCLSGELLEKLLKLESEIV